MTAKLRMKPQELKALAQSYSCQGKQFEMGIDEAGRGPVFGSMVYGGAWWPIDLSEQLKTLGFDDSKELSEAQRENLLEVMKSVRDKLIFFETEILSAASISNKMFGEGTHNENLNQQSHNAAMRLIQNVLDKGFLLKKVFLDTVGDPGKYQRKLKDRFRDYDLDIVVSTKADSLFKVVSAASIVAKVTRDHIIKDWKFVEPIQTVGDLGSGYPSDPKTKEWIRSNRDEVYGYPSLIRFSWGTCVEAMNPAYLVFPSEKWEKEKKKPQKGRLQERFGVTNSVGEAFTA